MYLGFLIPSEIQKRKKLGQEKTNVFLPPLHPSLTGINNIIIIILLK